jgi:hypothetical protein
MSQSYPASGEYAPISPLTSSVVEVVLPETKRSAVIMIGYGGCDDITDPDARTLCLAETQKVVHSKIYEQGEATCEKEVPEGGRFVHPGAGKQFFVVVTNGDQTKEHSFAILIE